MIYISCPSLQYTGGPTLAHQLCYILNQNGISASMYYIGKFPKDSTPVNKNYTNFHNPYVTELSNSTTDTIVFLETKTHLINQFPNAKKIIWWMSVDNFFMSKLNWIQRIKKKLGLTYLSVSKESANFGKRYKDIVCDKNIFHLYQSEYAKKFLLDNGIDPKSVHSLTDYIEDEIFEYAENHSVEERKNRVLYNPKKGIEYTKKIIEACSSYNIEFVPLINMTKTQISQILCSSKIYIDFGTHPGKDRFPREAAISGCCLLTGLRGSAGNDVDIAISKKYKFKDTDSSIKDIVARINYVFDNFEESSKDFETYRNKIKAEKTQFEEEALRIFGK